MESARKRAIRSDGERAKRAIRNDGERTRFVSYEKGRGGAAGGHQAPSPRDQRLSLFAVDLLEGDYYLQ